MDKGRVKNISAPVFTVEKFTNDEPIISPDTQQEAVLPKELNDYDYLLITKEKQIPVDTPTFTIAGATFAAPHNISIISGPPKGAKTAITGAMIAAAISDTGETEGFPDIKAMGNTGKAVLNFGTEQSEADEQYNLINILKRAGLTTTPDFLRCYNIRQLDYKNYKDVTDNICRLCSEKLSGIHSIFIDGGADYIGSVNDEKESTDIIQYFTHLSIRYNCPVIVIVHQNPTSQKGVEKKERGHFGSHVQRKCYGLITLEKQGEIFSLQPKMLRRSGNEDMPLINFKYSKELGYHVQVDAQDREKENDNKRYEELRFVAAEVFAPPGSFRNKDAVSRIMNHTKKGLSTAKSMLKNMEGFEFLVNDGGYYRLNMEKK